MDEDDSDMTWLWGLLLFVVYSFEVSQHESWMHEHN